MTFRDTVIFAMVIRSVDNSIQREVRAEQHINLVVFSKIL